MKLNKDVVKAKIEARSQSRELIRIVFIVTEHFPKNDPENLLPILRKKVLGISSYLTHGTVKSDKEEQNNDFLVVMSELREVLKLITIAHHLGYTTEKGKQYVREGISNFINSLDNLVILTGGFKEKE